MGILQTLLQILQILVAVIVMILVLLQSDNDNKNIMTGGSESSSAMGMSRDTKLAKYTRIMGIAFIVLTIATSTVMLLNVQ